MSRILAVIKKEFIHILRDPRYLFLAIFFPLIMIVIYGYGVTMEAKNIKMVIQDFDKTQISGELIETFKHYGYFIPTFETENYRRAAEILKSGGAKVILMIPDGFSQNLAKNQPQKIQLILDGADSNTANIAMNYLVSLINSFSENYLKVSGRLQNPLITLAPRVWFNPELDTNIYLVPGLMVIIMLLATVLLTALAIVGEREQGTFEQIGVSPLKPREILAGKLLPYGVIGYLDFGLVVVAGHFIFGVPLNGNLFLLFIIAGIFIACGLSLGLLISTIASSGVEAAMISFLSTIMPSFLLSNFVFPIANMPKILQVLSYLIPARYFMVIIRGILLKGSGIFELWIDVVYLMVFFLVVFNLAIRRLKKGAILQTR